MSIPVVCPQCSAKLNAPESAAGKKVKCPKCQTAMVVPTPLPEEPAFEVVDEPEPPKKPAAAKPVVKPKVKADVTVDEEEEKPRKKRVSAEIEDEKPRKKRQEESDEDEEDDRPRKKKKPAAGNSNMTRNIIGGVVLLVLLGVAGWVFYDKFGKNDDTAGNTNPPAQPGPNPPSGPIENPKLAKIVRLVGDWDQTVKSSTDALNKVVDKETALSAAKQLLENTEQVRKITQEMQGVEKPTAEELNQPGHFQVPERDGSVGRAYQTAEKRVVGLLNNGSLPPEARDAIHNALTNWARANLAFRDAFGVLIGKSGPPVGPGGNPAQPPKGDDRTLVVPGRFKVTFPGRYGTDDKMNAALAERYLMETKLYISGTLADGKAFSVWACTFPAGASADEKKKRSQSLRDYLTRNGIESSNAVAVRGRQWEEIALKDPKGTDLPLIRFLQTEKSVYALVGQKKVGDALTQFMDSFELLE